MGAYSFSNRVQQIVGFGALQQAQLDRIGDNTTNKLLGGSTDYDSMVQGAIDAFDARPNGAQKLC